MERERKIIIEECPLFACRVCRTKVGMPHQRWCPLAELSEPKCADCRYWSAASEKCGHPKTIKGGGIK